MNTIDAKTLQKAFLSGAKGLEAKKEWINKLNVFPIPGGDTGTNMTLTIMAAAKEVTALEEPTMETLAKAIPSGSLRGAKESPGVILSQLFRGFTKEIRTVNIIITTTLASAFVRATETAYKAVMRPKKGIIPAVAKGMANKAVELVTEIGDIIEFAKLVIEHGGYVLSQTPEMLPILRQAGVVDSGDQGLVQVMKGTLDELLGKEVDLTVETTKPFIQLEDGEAEKFDIHFGYCTELIINVEKKYDEREEQSFKGYLESIGDSTVVAPDDDVVEVHVYTNDPGLAIQKALTYGSLSHMKIDNMREKHEKKLIKDVEKGTATEEEEEEEKEALEAQSTKVEEKPEKPCGFIAISIGEGFGKIFKGIGADYLIEGGQTMNPSTEDTLSVIGKANAETIYILPNNSSIILAAGQTTRLVEDKNIVVIPSETVPQGITAIINFTPDMTPEENKETMIQEMKRVKTGQITYAVHNTVIDDKEIQEGDIMGIGDKGILTVDESVEGTAPNTLREMVDDSSELISIYYGSDISEAEANEFLEMVQNACPDYEIGLHSGGQPIYYYFMSVEQNRRLIEEPLAERQKQVIRSEDFLSPVFSHDEVDLDMKNQESVFTLKRIGERTGKLFAKLGIETVDDLSEYYPRACHSYVPPTAIGELKPDTTGTVERYLQKDVSVKRFKNKQIITASLQNMMGKLQLVWFNVPSLQTILKMGTYYTFCGRVVKENDRLTMEQPEIFTKESYGVFMGSMQPVYGQTRGLNNETITEAMPQTLGSRAMEREYLPADLRRKYELAEYNFAIQHIRFPDNQQELLFARKRLAFDEFLMFTLAVRRLKERRGDRHSSFAIAMAPEVEALKGRLPYSLTEAQQKTLSEVEHDLESGPIMNKLTQGDVGSGKTIIAILSLLHAAYNGYQGVLMVPTEVLAGQHYESMLELFEEQDVEKVPVLVTDSMTAKEKRIAYERIANRGADIIAGTHALIQDKMVYDSLALITTDEQHRFGVGQREMLGQKGQIPHVLVMNATPIPRTLAIVIYEGLGVSVIDELPANRFPIKNYVVDIDYRKTAYEFIKKQVAQGRQTYVIYPMVEASEVVEAESVLDYTESLKEAMPGVVIEYLHRKMKGREKDQIMGRFASGEIQVLVSITVIKVDANVPNAMVMMIEDVERFDLAQLHQLCGHVGRGKHQSYCIMISCSDQENTQERLSILNRSSDSFYIASGDLKLRGPRDVFDIRQSGDMGFKLADTFIDANLLKTVSEEVGLLLAKDPELLATEHEELKRRLDVHLERSYEELNL